MQLMRRSETKAALAAANLIVLSIGGNDLYGDSRARLISAVAPWYQRELVLDRVDRVVARVRRINPVAQVYVLGLYNPYRRSRMAPWLDEQVNLWDGQLIQRWASDPNVTVIRIADLLTRVDRLSRVDGFHPGSVGYAAIAQRVAGGL